MRDTIETKGDGGYRVRWASSVFIKTLVGILVATAISYLFIFVLYRDFIPIEKYLMEVIYSSLGFVTVDANWNSLIIYVPGKHIVTIVLTNECVGVYPIIIYCVLVAITPSLPIKEKLRGTLVGAPILFLANIVRIMASGVVGVEAGLPAFRFMHDFVGAGMMLLLTVTLWIDWIYRTSKYGRW